MAWCRGMSFEIWGYQLLFFVLWTYNRYVLAIISQFNLVNLAWLKYYFGNFLSSFQDTILVLNNQLNHDQSVQNTAKLSSLKSISIARFFEVFIGQKKVFEKFFVIVKSFFQKRFAKIELLLNDFFHISVDIYLIKKSFWKVLSIGLHELFIKQTWWKYIVS